MKRFPCVQLLVAVIGVTASSAQAQVSWQRQAYGQLEYIPGHQGDPAYAYHYPNNNNWSQQLTFAYDNSNPPKPLYETAPSNWSTDTFPKTGDVTLGNGGLGTNNTPTNYDRGATPVSLSSLTIQSDGGLNLEFGTVMTSALFNFQGNNNADATVTVSGGGGAWPVLNLTANGTMKKTTGTSSFMLDQGIVLQVLSGGTTSALGVAAHDDGPAFELRIVALLDGRVERVHVDVQDGAAGVVAGRAGGRSWPVELLAPAHRVTPCR